MYSTAAATASKARSTRKNCLMVLSEFHWFCLLPFAFCLMQVQSVCLFTISLFVGALKPVNANKHPAGNANIISKVFTVFG